MPFPPQIVQQPNTGQTLIGQNGQGAGVGQQAVLDTSFLTSMMKTHVKLMQKQLQDGFGLITNKMSSLESKIGDNEQQIQRVAQSREVEASDKARVSNENKKLFQRLQESIATQQQSMLQYIDRTDQQLDQVRHTRQASPPKHQHQQSSQ